MDITTEKELAQAIKENADTITITGNLAKSTIRIKATGKVAWAIAIAAIGISAAAAYATVGTGGTAAPVTSLAALGGSGAAVSILGTTASWSAISIAVAAGGVGVLNKLRKYKITEKSGNRVVLKRK